MQLRSCNDMAWYTINYVCGHSDREQLYGPTAGRESHVDWAERKKVCPACWTEEQDRLRAKALLEARESNAGLPALLGSVKQIQWAETIRATAQRNLAQVIGTAVNSQELAQKAADFAARVMRQTESRYWIDHRMDYATPQSTQAYVVRRLIETEAAARGKELLDVRIAS
jgi:hypothetical protein